MVKKKYILELTENGWATICMYKNAFIIGIYSALDHFKYDGMELNCC